MSKGKSTTPRTASSSSKMTNNNDNDEPKSKYERHENNKKPSTAPSPHRSISINNNIRSDSESFETEMYDDDESSVTDSVLIQALAKRSYHIPGNSYCDDFTQWFFNGHPVLGICCRHPLHPVRVEERLILLMGSFSFGLAATCGVYIWFYYEDEDMEAVVYTLQYMDYSVRVTQGMIALFTVGCFFHSVYDYLLWHVTACACCQPGGFCSAFGCCSWIGSPTSFFIVLITMFVAAMSVMIRSDISVAEGESKGEMSLTFITGYLLELTLALFCYSPVVGFIMFSGVLGCGRLPVLGGRPRSMRQLEC